MPLKAAVLLVGVVVYSTSRQAAIGNHNHLVVIGSNDGVEYLNLLHKALVAVEVDIVAHLIGLNEQNEHAARKV